MKNKSIVTKESLEESKSIGGGRYFSGKEMKIGDTICFGFLFLNQESDKSYNMQLISYTEDELDTLYELDTRSNKTNTSIIPHIKYKNNE